MMLSAITFPHLGLSFDLDRVAFSMFGKPIYWYGVLIAGTIVLCAFYACRRAPQFGTTSDDVLDMLLWAVPIAILCARAYYVVFNWHVDGFDKDPIRVLYIWEGGLAIYGGVIGAAVTVLLVSRRKKMPCGVLLDLGGLGLPLGQAIGRWGNFINQEAFGGYTDSLLAMRVAENHLPHSLSESARALLLQKAQEGGYEGFVQVHPTFFYESYWNLLGFVLLHFYSKKRKFDGEVFCLYLAWYGLGRVWIEGLRTDSLYIGSTGIRVSQLLAAVTSLAAIGVILYVRLVKKPDMLYVDKKAAQAAKEEETTHDDP